MPLSPGVEAFIIFFAPVQICSYLCCFEVWLLASRVTFCSLRHRVNRLGVFCFVYAWRGSKPKPKLSLSIPAGRGGRCGSGGVKGRVVDGRWSASRNRTAARVVRKDGQLGPDPRRSCVAGDDQCPLLSSTLGASVRRLSLPSPPLGSFGTDHPLFTHWTTFGFGSSGVCTSDE